MTDDELDDLVVMIEAAGFLEHYLLKKKDREPGAWTPYIQGTYDKLVKDIESFASPLDIAVAMEVIATKNKLR